jgi:predicted Zn-dependent peptidase
LYYETRHKSGLRVLVSPKDFSACYATLGVGYGSRDRLAFGRVPMGTAHFLEHKMFERDPDRFDGSDSYDDDFAACGAESNAYTSHDRTVYYFSCTDRFPDALTALLSMVSELYVTPESVTRERAIIAEEIRMNADDPWETCCSAARRSLFGKHPVQEEICGSEASLRRVTPAVLREAFETFYRPDNMVLTVCGRVTPEEVCAAARTAMEGLSPEAREPLPPALPRIRVMPAVFASRTAEYRPVPKPIFCIGVKCPALPAGREALAYLAEMLLAENMRLAREYLTGFTAIFEYAQWKLCTGDRKEAARYAKLAEDYYDLYGMRLEDWDALMDFQFNIKYK